MWNILQTPIAPNIENFLSFPNIMPTQRAEPPLSTTTVCRLQKGRKTKIKTTSGKTDKSFTYIVIRAFRAAVRSEAHFDDRRSCRGFEFCATFERKQLEPTITLDS